MVRQVPPSPCPWTPLKVLLTELSQQESSSASPGTPRDDLEVSFPLAPGREQSPIFPSSSWGSVLLKDPPALVINSWDSQVFVKMEGGAGGAELSPSDPSQSPTRLPFLP